MTTIAVHRHCLHLEKLSTYHERQSPSASPSVEWNAAAVPGFYVLILLLCGAFAHADSIDTALACTMAQ